MPTPTTESGVGHGPARLRVLSALKRMGPVTAEDLAGELAVTPMAVRLHLYALQDDGLAAHQRSVRSRGRPAKLWSATAAADPFFTDAHAALTADLLANMRAIFGEKGLDKILAARTRVQAKTYATRLGSKNSLHGRLKELARIRSEEGYMAEVRPGGDGCWLFLENHCPICAAAHLCTGLCREELALFKKVIGKDIHIERIDHIITGARRCVYRVSPK